MSGLLSTGCKGMVEGFLGYSDSEARRGAQVDFVSMTLAFILAVIIIGIAGKYLWNNVVVDLFTIAKPARSFWQIVGLMVFVGLIRP